MSTRQNRIVSADAIGRLAVLIPAKDRAAIVDGRDDGREDLTELTARIDSRALRGIAWGIVIVAPMWIGIMVLVHLFSRR